MHYDIMEKLGQEMKRLEFNVYKSNIQLKIIKDSIVHFIMHGWHETNRSLKKNILILL